MIYDKVPMPELNYDGYYLIDRFLRNNLDDDDYAEYMSGLQQYGDLREAAGYARGLVEAKRDAERYRWLRENGDQAIGRDRGCGPEWTYGEELDALIDAALHGEVKP